MNATSDSLWFPYKASTVASQVDNIYFFIAAVTVFFTVFIGALSLYFAFRYKRRSANEQGKPIHGNHILEILWVVVPTIIVLVIFFWGAVVFFQIKQTPKGALEFYGVGKQWMWKFQHPSGQREINDLHVPTGKPIQMTLTSEDVIHSFYVPAFRVKMDVLPGRYTSVWFEATRPGEYHLFCAEYCGTKHSQMIGKVIVMTPEDYAAWLKGAEGAAVAAAPAQTQTPAESGKRLFEEFRCNTCHTAVATALGPALDGVFGSTVELVTGEKIVANDEYVRESILYPQAKVIKGFAPVMPTFKTQLSEEQLMQIVAYLKTLGGSGEKVQA